MKRIECKIVRKFPYVKNYPQGWITKSGKVKCLKLLRCIERQLCK